MIDVDKQKEASGKLASHSIAAIFSVPTGRSLHTQGEYTMDEQRGNVPQHEGTNRLGQEVRQRLFNLHQREHGDAMEEEYNAIYSRVCGHLVKRDPEQSCGCSQYSYLNPAWVE
jgi:hypothetical protein